MERILSTYRFLHQQLNNALLAEIAAAGFTSVEVFCAPHHFNYSNSQAVRELGDSLREHKLTLHSLHSPTERDLSPGRESGVPLSISEPERIRRLDAVDEIKRTLEVSEKVPCKYLIQHMGQGRQAADPRKLDAAFTSLENLSMFAKARGVTIALENTPSELGSPSWTKASLPGLKPCAIIWSLRTFTIIMATRMSICCPSPEPSNGMPRFAASSTRPKRLPWCSKSKARALHRRLWMKSVRPRTKSRRSSPPCKKVQSSTRDKVRRDRNRRHS